MLDPDWKTSQFVRRVLRTFAFNKKPVCIVNLFGPTTAFDGREQLQCWCRIPAGIVWGYMENSGSSAPRFLIRVVHAGEASGLIAYECPACGYVTSVLMGAERNKTDRS